MGTWTSNDLRVSTTTTSLRTEGQITREYLHFVPVDLLFQWKTAAGRKKLEKPKTEKTSGLRIETDVTAAAALLALLALSLGRPRVQFVWIRVGCGTWCKRGEVRDTYSGLPRAVGVVGSRR